MKRENLFDSINGNFFQILTRQNKRFYADCLIEMYDVSIFTDAADFDRERVNQIISNCMEWYADTLAEENASDEDDTHVLQGQEKTDTRCPPTKDSVFRKLLACGWIDADFDDQTHRQLVSFTVSALTIIPELKRMAQPSRISLGGYTRNIIDNLKAVLTARHPYQDAFMLALNNTYQFMQEMAKIRISIKSEVETILRCKNLEEMTSMLSAYLDSYLDGDYYKLQFAENLTVVERKQITGLLMDIENNEEVFQKLIEGAMDYMSIDNEEDANLLILRSAETIRSRLCDEYERQYREIQKNQARYVNNAAGRMPMLIADKKDTDSTINRLVLALSECDDEVYDGPTMPLAERDKAVEDLRAWAEDGDATAQYFLAKLYRDGGLLVSDSQLAADWFYRAARQNLVTAQYALGKLLLSEDNDVRDTMLSMEWLEYAAGNGSHYAAYRVGKEYLRGKIVKKDVAKALRYLTDAANAENQYAQYLLGKLYLAGSVTKRDIPTAEYWFSQSARQGNQYAQFFLDRMGSLTPASFMLSATRLLRHMANIFRDNSLPKTGPVGMRIDRKRLQKLREKKIAMGHKPDDHEEYAGPTLSM